MQGPKIFHLISSSAYLGAENVVMELARSSCRDGGQVVIGVIENSRLPNTELADMAKRENLPVYIFTCADRFDWHTCMEIRNVIRSDQPDILHSHNYKSNFYAFLAKGRKPWVVTNHLWKRTTLSLRLYALIDAFIIRFANAIVAVSKEISHEMKRCGIPEKKITVIDNGIDLKRFDTLDNDCRLRKSFGLDQDDIIIGTVASLTVEKGHALLLDAAAGLVERFPRLRLFFVGDGPERSSLERKVSELGLGKYVVFAGRRSDIPELLGIMDGFVLPSYKEGLPMALLEAQAAGIPSIATTVGAVPELITDGETGLLIEPGATPQLAAALERLLTDRAGAAQMGKRGRERVRESFSSERMAGDYRKVYQNLLEMYRGSA